MIFEFYFIYIFLAVITIKEEPVFEEHSDTDCG